MTTDPTELYQQRLNRYVTAMRNGKPDRIPIRPFVAEFTARYAGYTCQDVAHDYRKAFDAVLRCAGGFDWDAMVPNMVYVWTGWAQALGIRYFGVPGVDIPADVGFQYREPPEHSAFMLREEYDELIEDPTRFLYQVWMPRISSEISAGGRPATYRHNISLVKGGMSLLSYFYAFGPQVERMRTECGTVSAISGMLKAPLDILADKLRGYVGLAMDLMEIPDKVTRACYALMPHLAHVAISGLDPTHNVPVPIWMHRGCVPFISRAHFETIYWPTLRPIVQAIWSRGNQVLFYAEGNWDAHLERFSELPAGSIVYHVDRGDIALARKVFGNRFCLSGGIPNDLLSYGTAAAVRACCKKVIDAVAGEGGYIMDAGAIIQNDATVENMQALTDFTREYGVYSAGPAPDPGPPANRGPATDVPACGIRPGTCLPWEQKVEELGTLSGDIPMLRQVWEEIDEFAYQYIWNMLLI